TPTEVFEMPANVFVAEFIGAPKMNIMTTRLEKREDGYHVSPYGVDIRVDGEKGEALQAKNVPEQDIKLGVRPEHIVLKDENDPSAIPCTLEVNEMMGSELHLHVYTESGDRIIVRVPTLNLTAAQRASLVRGCSLHIGFEGKVMHFFNAESGLNLLYEAPDSGENAPAPEPDEADVQAAVDEIAHKTAQTLADAARESAEAAQAAVDEIAHTTAQTIVNAAKDTAEAAVKAAEEDKAE
ncbi:MAG: TOBE domain-containing protein, partial [Clostridia bacterium]|nr:TOBE domain-containing protein [Clostridia bacterium]